LLTVCVNINITLVPNLPGYGVKKGEELSTGRENEMNMNFGLNDTTPEIEKILIAGYRQMTPQQKLQRVTELTQAIQQLALARIRQQYGEICNLVTTRSVVTR